MNNKVKFSCIEDSIFEIEKLGLEGVAIFVPSGMTFIRPYTEYFIDHYLELLRDKGFLALYRIRNNNKFVFIDQNRSNQSIDEVSAKQSIDRILKWFANNGVRKIGMNGIKLSHSTLIPEVWLYREVKHWTSINKNDFEEICFVDLRGGFNKINMV
jgi:hypothetical protein